MAFGRKKRKGEQEEAEEPGANSEQTVGEPSNGAFPPAPDTQAGADAPAPDAPAPDAPAPDAPAGDAPAGEPSPPTATHHSVGEAEPDDPSPRPAAGEELAEATATAGDPAAAGTDAEGPGAARPVHTSTHEVAAAGGAGAGPPGATATAEHTGPETAGSVAASPDPAAVPTAHSHGSYGEARGGEDSAAEKVGAAAAGVGSMVESRPELLVAAAFAAGLVVARVLGAFGGDR